jgi:hypothetical protein
VKEKDAKKNTEDWGEEGESREPTDRIVVDEFEPY